MIRLQIQVLRGSCRVISSAREEGGAAAREGAAGAMDRDLVPAGSRHRVEADGDCLLLVSLSPHPAAARYPRELRDRIVSRAPHQAV